MKQIPKNNTFRAGIFLTVFEGLLSGGSFLLLFFVLQSLWAGSLSFQSTLLLTLLTALLFLVRIAVYAIAYTLSQIGGANVSRDLRLSLGDILREIPLSRLTDRRIADFTGALTDDISRYEQVLTHKIGDLAKNITLSVLMIGFAWMLYPKAGMVLLAGDLLLIPTFLLSFRMVDHYGSIKHDALSRSVDSVMEYVSGIQTLRAYGACGKRNTLVDHALKDFSDISYRYESKVIPVGSIYGILIWMASPLILVLGADDFLNGSLSAVSYLMCAMMPLMFSKLGQTVFVDLTSYRNMQISKKHILEVSQQPQETGCTFQKNPDSSEIVFQDVWFGYEKKVPVLRGTSFTIPSGKLTAFVGDSGSGKSTILNLIGKFYEADSGDIQIGGTSILPAKAESVLSFLSIVDQNVFLFDDTVRENIRYARTDATEEDVLKAVKEANCEEFIQNLPEGLDTRIGENGGFLSGGQRQRLSIARAILKNSPILLLDEATASLDIENELAVKQAVSRLLKKDKTVVMVAHTLSVIRGAAQILVLDQGVIRESGTHEELLAKQGKYAAMWEAEQRHLQAE